MSKPTDWSAVADDIVDATVNCVDMVAAVGDLRARIAAELQSAFVAGMEASGAEVVTDQSRVAPRVAPASRSLERFFTVAFDREVMRRLIRTDLIHSRIDAVEWFECIVPQCYRRAVMELVNAVSPQFINRKLTPDVLEAFVRTLQASIFESLEPVNPGELAR